MRRLAVLLIAALGFATVAHGQSTPPTGGIAIPDMPSTTCYTGFAPGSPGAFTYGTCVDGTDHVTGQHGGLFTDPVTGLNSNTPPAQYDADARQLAASLQPLDTTGAVNTTAGRIVADGLGMSNINFKMAGYASAGPNQRTFAQSYYPYSFLPQAQATLAANAWVIPCTHSGWQALRWVDNNAVPGSYSSCPYSGWAYRVNGNPVTVVPAKQVQVVIFEDADAGPPGNLQKGPAGVPFDPMTATTDCQYFSPGVTSTTEASGAGAPPGSPSLGAAGHLVDACAYEQYIGMMARFVKTIWPNVKMIFLLSRTFGGYATVPLSPEPYAYEYGFATKQLVYCQMLQQATGVVPVQNGPCGAAGDLGYTVADLIANGGQSKAPMLLWGPSWWAAGATPCGNCTPTTGGAQVTWLSSDFCGPTDPTISCDSLNDFTHPNQSGVTKAADVLLNFFNAANPYTPWW